MPLDVRTAETALAYRLGLLVTLSRREAARLAAAAVALPAGAPGGADGAPDPGSAGDAPDPGGAPDPGDVAARLAAVLGPRLPGARGGERWSPWRELQSGDGPPDAWDIALAVARLPARRRALVALCAVGELPPVAAAGALGLDGGRAEAELAAALRAVAGAVPGRGELTAAAVARALRHVLAQEPVPPALAAAVAAAGRAASGLDGDGGGAPAPRPAGDSSGMPARAVAAGTRPRRPGWQGVAAAVLVAGALGLAIAPDAARWLGGPVPGEPAAPGGGPPESAGTPGAGTDSIPGDGRAYEITRTEQGVVAIGDPLADCDPTAPLDRQAGFVLPLPMIRSLSTVASEEWGRVQGEMGLLAIREGPVGWEIAAESRSWLTRLDLRDCRPVIQVEVGRAVRREVVFRYGDHVVILIEFSFAQLPDSLPDGQPVHVAGWPAQQLLLGTSAAEATPGVLIWLPEYGPYRRLVAFQGRAGRAPLPADELLAHLEDFVPVLLGPPPAAPTCNETPAQDRWPDDYGQARGQSDIWLIDNGAEHRVGAQRTVGWRVIGAVDSLAVRAKRLDGPETFEVTVTDRVAHNGRDPYPEYWDAVSHLTFPSAGCWELRLQAGPHDEQITLKVR